MNARTPTLRQKRNGAYFVRWGGKDHYLSTDRATAEQLFFDPESTHPGCLMNWRRWRALRDHDRLIAGPLVPNRLTVAEVVDLLLASYAADDRLDTARYFRKHLTRWTNLHGRQLIETLATPRPEAGRHRPPVIILLEALKADMASMKYGPRTINHDLGAVQRLFNFAAEQGHAPAVLWNRRTKLRVPASKPVYLPPPRVREIVRAIDDDELRTWVSLNYLTLARPSEMIRIVGSAAALARGLAPTQARAAWMPIRDRDNRRSIARGLLELLDHKMAHKRQARLVFLSDEALELLEHAVLLTNRRLTRPSSDPLSGLRWSRLDSYSTAARSAGVPGGPSVLRDSAASHLRQPGERDREVDQLLGHGTPGVLPSYAQGAFLALRAIAAELSLR